MMTHPVSTDGNSLLISRRISEQINYCRSGLPLMEILFYFTRRETENNRLNDIYTAVFMMKPLHARKNTVCNLNNYFRFHSNKHYHDFIIKLYIILKHFCYIMFRRNLKPVLLAKDKTWFVYWQILKFYMSIKAQIRVNI